MRLKGTAVLPHSLVLAAPKEDRFEKTVRGLKDISLEVAKAKPDTIVLITKQGNVFEDAVGVDYASRLSGSWKLSAEAGSEEISMEKECDMGLLEEINRRAGREELPVFMVNERSAEEFGISQELSPAAFIPLYYIDRVFPDYKIVQLTAGDLSPEVLYQVGMIVREASEANGKDVFVLACADLSTNLASDDPVYAEASADYDGRVQADLADADYLSLMQLRPNIIRDAGAEDHDVMLMILGMFEKIKTESKVLSFEDVEGTGSLCSVSTFMIDDKDFVVPSLLAVYEDRAAREREALRAGEHEILKMIRAASNLWVREQRKLDFPTYASLINDQSLREELESRQAGVFVTVMKDGKLRGCMGSINPFGDNIGEAFINYTIEALSYDPRFMPVEEEELGRLQFTADILDIPEDVEEASELDPSIYGLIVEQGVHRSVLLPNLPGIRTAEQQIAEGKEKAGISSVTLEAGEPLVMKRFRTEHFD